MELEESEAKKMWCFNAPRGNCCLGSKCMAWVWSNDEPNSKLGFCGLVNVEG